MYIMHATRPTTPTVIRETANATDAEETMVFSQKIKQEK